MKVLVTGAAGFIGSTVAHRLLDRGDEVLGIDNVNAYYSAELKRDRLARLQARGDGFGFIEEDFSRMAELENALRNHEFQRIIHLGAQAGVRYSIENPHAYLTSNLAGHLNMLEIARHRGVEHLVYASSSSVYGGNTKLPFSVEDRVDHPLSLYAATKKADELMSETYAHLYGLPQTGLRFFTVYGPWGRPDMAYFGFTGKILAGEPIEVYGEGKMARDFTYIDDIVDGILGALDHPPEPHHHRILNIGDSRPVGLMDMIRALEDALGIEAEKIMRPMQPGDVTSTYADVSRLHALTGYAPKVMLEDGLKQFVRWYRDFYGNLPPT